MPAAVFIPHLLVHHVRRVPQPILPVNYAFFLSITLPAHIRTLPLQDQLVMAKAGAQRRLAYPFTGPFGEVVAFEYRLRTNATLYLNSTGVFV